MSEAPPFWFEKPGFAAWALSPLAAIYGRVAARRMRQAPSAFSSLPVLCVGNLIAGGAGKTPTAIAFARLAEGMGLKPGFLSRGYGAVVKAPKLVDLEKHNSRDVGDEPLVLAQTAPTVVSPDRPAGARVLEEAGVDLIIMDDGFQNPSLHKDTSILVIDAGRGIGNGFCHPAGPVRAMIPTQLSRAHAMLLIGRSEAGTAMVRRAAKAAKPILTGQIAPRSPDRWKGKRVYAFAGIAEPQKFFGTLEALGAEIMERRAFSDHHIYMADDCHDMLTAAQEQDLLPVTTQKDAARLLRMGVEQDKLRDAAAVLEVDMVFENPKMGELILRETLKRAEAGRLRRAKG